MKFKLELNYTINFKEIAHQNQLFFLGSCFSDEISKKFKNAGFKVLSNPLGTIFHPTPTAEFLSELCTNYILNDFFVYENRVFKSNSAKKYKNPTIEDLKACIEKEYQTYKNSLKTCSHIFITFGTAYAYSLLDNNKIVANCHKIPNHLFEKKISSVIEMFEIWDQTILRIKTLNPNIEIIFTVSPVRHIKDGLVENNRSKSRLFELISLLEEKHAVKYFPSYEIINDELRDYRFFKEDLIHPTQQAVDYVWLQIKNQFFSQKTLQIVNDVENLNKFLNHTVLSESLDEKVALDKQKQHKKQLLMEKYPEINFK